MGQLLDFTAYKLQEIANSLDNPQDIEWLFEGDTIYIVQSRPYVQR